MGRFIFMERVYVMRSPVFTGVCPALVTPFHEGGGINFESFANLIEFQIRGGVSALCVCGTTGEASTMTREERDTAIRFCVKQASGRVKVIAGAGSNSTAVTVELSLRAQEMGADALLLVTPYYNKASQTGLVRHYETVANQVALPIILYNVPGRTGLSFTAETYHILAEHPQINGVKEASGNFDLINHTRALCPEDFYLWSGNDDQVVPLMALGGKGVISVASNIIPETMTELCGCCLHHDFAQAAALQFRCTPLFDALFSEVNPIQIKTAMNLLGMDTGELRLPLCPPSKANLQRLLRVLEQMELL